MKFLGMVFPILLLISSCANTQPETSASGPVGKFQWVGNGVLDTTTGILWSMNPEELAARISTLQTGDNVMPVRWIQISQPIPAK
jgi:hypothetical protein